MQNKTTNPIEVTSEIVPAIFLPCFPTKQKMDAIACKTTTAMIEKAKKDGIIISKRLPYVFTCSLPVPTEANKFIPVKLTALAKRLSCLSTNGQQMTSTIGIMQHTNVSIFKTTSSDTAVFVLRVEPVAFNTTALILTLLIKI